jgi:hypothetical protein
MFLWWLVTILTIAGADNHRISSVLDVAIATPVCWAMWAVVAFMLAAITSAAARSVLGWLH